MRNIRVASVQFEHASGDRQTNLAKIKNFVIRSNLVDFELWFEIFFPQFNIINYVL